MNFTKQYRLKPGRQPRLTARMANDTAGWKKDEALQKLAANTAQLADLQAKLYADGRHSVLVVLQGMDTSGKDGTIRHVFGPMNPQGCRVTSFKAPTRVELAHDFLWRVHRAVPARGELGIFNRSHYEDVLVVRVNKLVPPAVWRTRYDRINEFERLLADHGTVIVKFFLHISKAEQKDRLQARLDDPRKHWKFEPADLATRAQWPAYEAAYADALRQCSTPQAPWFVIPANKKWFRNLAISEIMVETLSRLPLRYPQPKLDLRQVRLR